ncbi:anthranilate synthase component 1 [Drechslerella stenobrocha 248]|uniref:anthranilate synthase n=1 Tax=Drechslerella stenobrocha 248 TaxID=1043628 RepID=W7IEX8_9PEZI|nr:anthranilate synthase component 1 [Drechslerella stenobrocha 248]
MKIRVEPSVEALLDLIQANSQNDSAPNIYPLATSIPADLLTPSGAYLKLVHATRPENSFLFESAPNTGSIGRYSFVGIEPREVIKTGPGHGPASDPLTILQAELDRYRIAKVPGLKLPPLSGGAIGYVAYDCVKYFEPKTERPLKDVLGVPEALFMLFDTIVAFDHFFQKVQVITHLHLATSSPSESDVKSLYATAQATLSKFVHTIIEPTVSLPEQPPIVLDQKFTSNIGQDGYEAHVRKLKEHIIKGDIIQAVPSQRFARPTTLHPFNIYRELRTVNPSPYLFYVDCADFSLVGASPELLVKATESRIVTHPIAGTLPRGETAEEDAANAARLSASIKDRAEHVMLVDLARNDVNRVCDPLTVKVDHLMNVERFSHVMHLVSQVSGTLAADKTRFDAFRSIFPAGTVSGAPKVRAMELIAECEGEKRGVYGGAVGYWGYDDHMDTCIALRTMTVKKGVAYLQAGGGIVYDSVPFDEWEETMNKAMGNMIAIKEAEERYADEEL